MKTSLSKQGATRHKTRRVISKKIHLKRLRLAEDRGLIWDNELGCNRDTLYKQLKSTSTPCSCHLCCNPRNVKQSAKYKLTIQELRADANETEQIAEYYITTPNQNEC